MKAFNLFYFVESCLIKELGVVVHDITQNDEDAQAFLLANVSKDFQKCKRFPLPNILTDIRSSDSIDLSTYIALFRVGRHMELFEDIFIKYQASINPMCCITPIVDGAPQVDILTDHSPFRLGNYQGHPKIGPGAMEDYMQKYSTPNGFDLPRLLNDDYFEAIKPLFREQHYASCMKLIVSFLDTVAYLEYGDIKDSFTKWLDTFSNLKQLNISSSQLWEFRNSILHMSNLDSRKILKGREKRISFFVCNEQYKYPNHDDIEIAYFNLKDLIHCIIAALSGWMETFVDNEAKIILFIQRYDRVISDHRYAIVAY